MPITPASSARRLLNNLILSDRQIARAIRQTEIQILSDRLSDQSGDQTESEQNRIVYFTSVKHSSAISSATSATVCQDKGVNTGFSLAVHFRNPDRSKTE